MYHLVHVLVYDGLTDFSDDECCERTSSRTSSSILASRGKVTQSQGNLQARLEGFPETGMLLGYPRTHYG